MAACYATGVSTDRADDPIVEMVDVMGPMLSGEGGKR
jgi:hypothetical protein